MQDECQITVATFNKAAQRYQDKFMDVGLYHTSLDTFCRNLAPNARVLELGCGPGNITRYLLDNLPSIDILATDLAPNMLTLTQKNCPEVATQLLDCRALGALVSNDSSTTPLTGFDALIAGFCLPYLNRENVNQLFTDIKAVCRSKAFIYLSTMEGSYQNSGKQTSSQGDSVYTYYHERDWLTETLKQHGLQVIELLEQRYPDTDSTSNASGTDLIIIARTP